MRGFIYHKERHFKCDYLIRKEKNSEGDGSGSTSDGIMVSEEYDSSNVLEVGVTKSET